MIFVAGKYLKKVFFPIFSFRKSVKISIPGFAARRKKFFHIQLVNINFNFISSIYIRILFVGIAKSWNIYLVDISDFYRAGTFKTTVYKNSQGWYC